MGNDTRDYPKLKGTLVPRGPGQVSRNGVKGMISSKAD